MPEEGETSDKVTKETPRKFEEGEKVDYDGNLAIVQHFALAGDKSWIYMIKIVSKLEDVTNW